MTTSGKDAETMKESDDLKNNAPLADKEKAIRLEHHLLRRKLVMLVSAGVMLVAVLLTLGVAWYTRVANIYAVTFEVADYDLSVNKNVNEKFNLNVYDYAAVTNKKMAPGTIGWLPLEISAEYSKVDVEYRIAVESQMGEVLDGHFRFFVLKETEASLADETDLTDAEKTALLGTYHMGPAITKESDLWNYEIEVLEDIDDVVTGTMTKGTTQTLCIYWEWYYDCSDAVTKGKTFDGILWSELTAEAQANWQEVNASFKGITWSELTEAKQSAVVKAWDDLDTDVGRYPEKYKEALDVFVYTSGTQIEPQAGVATTAATTEAETTTAAPSSSENQ